MITNLSTSSPPDRARDQIITNLSPPTKAYITSYSWIIRSRTLTSRTWRGSRIRRRPGRSRGRRCAAWSPWSRRGRRPRCGRRRTRGRSRPRARWRCLEAGKVWNVVELVVLGRDLRIGCKSNRWTVRVGILRFSFDRCWLLYSVIGITDFYSKLFRKLLLDAMESTNWIIVRNLGWVRMSYPACPIYIRYWANAQKTTQFTVFMFFENHQVRLYWVNSINLDTSSNRLSSHINRKWLSVCQPSSQGYVAYLSSCNISLKNFSRPNVGYPDTPWSLVTSFPQVALETDPVGSLKHLKLCNFWAKYFLMIP